MALKALAKFKVGELVYIRKEFVWISTYFDTVNPSDRTVIGLIIKANSFSSKKNDHTVIKIDDNTVYYVMTSVGMLEVFNFDLEEVCYGESR